MDKITIYILCMALVTFCIRYSFFSKHFRISFNPVIKKILTYTAPCLLTAIWVPIIYTNSTVEQELLSPYLLGTFIAIICSLLIKNTLAIIIISLSSFYLFDYLL